MSDAQVASAPAAPQAEPPLPKPTEAVRLRAPSPRIVRLSPKVLIGLSATSAAALSGLVLFALHMHGPHAPATNLVDAARPNPAEAVKNAASDYAAVHQRAAPTGNGTPGAGGAAMAVDGSPAGVPKLGPALPGDLGRPILNAQAQGSVSPMGGEPIPTTPTAEPATVDPVRQKLAQERVAALTSPLFPGGETAAPGAQPIALTAAEPAAQTVASTAAAGASATGSGSTSSTSQEHKLAFLNGPADTKVSTDTKVESAERLQAPSSPYVVQAGTAIPAALLTGIRSDLPGQITAQVSEDVYDSPTGRYRLIPQGARLVGQYDSGVAFGQSRVLLVWTRLILPDGRSIVLERLPGADPAGNAGLQDGVDNHWGQLFKAAALSSILGIGTQIGASDNENGLIQALRQGPADTLNQAGQQVIGRSLNIQPTLSIRPGFQIRVLVNRDLVLEPYSEPGGG